MDFALSPDQQEIRDDLNEVAQSHPPRQLINFAKSDNHGAVTEPAVLPYDSEGVPPITRQDYGNIPIQQQGLHPKSFGFVRSGQGVAGLISNCSPAGEMIHGQSIVVYGGWTRTRYLSPRAVNSE